MDGSARRAGRSNPAEEQPAGLVGAVCRWSASQRQIVEGIIWQLKDLSSVERHRTKTLGGLLTRLAAKVAAYTCGQLLNVRLGRPLRHLADLLI